jgi:hypothetical protein
VQEGATIGQGDELREGVGPFGTAEEGGVAELLSCIRFRNGEMGG